MTALMSCVVGIDVSKLTLDVFVLPAQSHFVVGNDPAGIAQLLEKMAEHAPDAIVLEATGKLEFAAARALADAGFTVHRLNPARVHAFRKSLGKLAKTDKLDAALLARFALVMDLEDRPLPTAAAQAIRDLGARRRQLVDLLGMERNRLKQADAPLITESIRTVMTLLKTQLQAIEKSLLQAIADDPLAKRRYEVLTSIPGIGPAVAATLVIDMPELGQLNRRQVASLAGLAPQDQQSGTTLDHAPIRGGRPCVRRAVYMAALVACHKGNPDAKAFYRKLIENNKNKKLAVLAVARKLITLANQLVREDREWTPEAPNHA
jgi:transposase